VAAELAAWREMKRHGGGGEGGGSRGGSQRRLKLWRESWKASKNGVSYIGYYSIGSDYSWPVYSHLKCLFVSM
jgi:hypothetical protein